GELLSTVSGVALCRCGASKNKPFCDGIHGTIGFSTENKVVQSATSTSADSSSDDSSKKRSIRPCHT
ncbi:MAG: CDGSH iron-sulfur domain-containing protein, partial [Candidatus Nitrosopolaris sp.]